MSEIVIALPAALVLQWMVFCVLLHCRNFNIYIQRLVLFIKVIFLPNRWFLLTFHDFIVQNGLQFSVTGETLPYPRGVLGAEVVLLFILAGLEAIRIFFGSFHNIIMNFFCGS